MAYKLIFFDTETTGNGPEDRLCQIAYKEGGNGVMVAEMFKPPLPMTIESMAICHITDKMLIDKKPFSSSILWQKWKELALDENNIFVAHNAKFDIEMLQKEGIEIHKFIDTLKMSRFLDKDAQIGRHNLQYLRYYYEFEIDATAHDASGDVLILEALFEELKKQMKKEYENDNDEEIVEKMVKISFEPMMIKVFTFGKYNGQKVEEVARTDPGYLRWLLDQKLASPNIAQEDDWIYTLKYYLQKPQSLFK